MRRTNPSGRVRRTTYVAFPARDYSSLDVTVTPLEPSARRVRRRVPNARMPKDREDWRIGSDVSALVHLLVLVLLVSPLLITAELTPIAQGAGGPGPAGGGGGSSGGEGLKRELLQFVRVAPPAARPAAAQPKVVVPPPRPVPQTPPAPVVPTPAAQDATASPTAPSTGGQDAGGGAGPGSGGGVGSGTGTGAGSGSGPGTGGGTQADYPPTPQVMFIPPLPTPASVKGFHLRVQFDVDATGRVLNFNFTPTPDGGYNRKLRDLFNGFRFRPGSHPDGTPIRMIAELDYIL